MSANWPETVLVSARASDIRGPAPSAPTASSTGIFSREFLQQLLTCTKCNQMCVSLPIFQCRKGHLICDKCYNKSVFATCKICKDLLGWDSGRIHCLLAETIAQQSVDMHCTNKKLGCPLTFNWSYLKTHVLDCPFGLNGFCKKLFENHSSSTCNSVRRSDLAIHFQSVHGLTGVLNGQVGELNQGISLSGFAGWNNMNYCNYVLFDGKIFLLKTKLHGFTDQLSTKVILLGSSVDARNYRVKLTFHFGASSGAKKLQAYKIEWEGLVVGFDCKNTNANQKFLVPWDTFQDQKKRFERDGRKFVWKVTVEVEKNQMTLARQVPLPPLPVQSQKFDK